MAVSLCSDRHVRLNSIWHLQILFHFWLLTSGILFDFDFDINFNFFRTWLQISTFPVSLPGIPSRHSTTSLPSRLRTKPNPTNDVTSPGDLVSLSILGKPLMIVNSARVAHDLFEKRSGLYSDRWVIAVQAAISISSLLLLLFLLLFYYFSPAPNSTHTLTWHTCGVPPFPFLISSSLSHFFSDAFSLFIMLYPFFSFLHITLLYIS